MRTVALAGWPVLNFPVALFEVDDNGACDLVLLIHPRSVIRACPGSGADAPSAMGSKQRASFAGRTDRCIVR
jgi:hypothetical protein